MACNNPGFLSFCGILDCQSIYFGQRPELISIGVAIDLTLGIPALFFISFCASRKNSLLILFPVFLISLAIATIIIPSGNQHFLTSEKKIVPAL